MSKLNLIRWGKPTENLENWTNGQQKICLSHHVLFSAERSSCVNNPHINVLSVGTSSYLNVETEPKTKWSGDWEIEPTENLHLGNGISVLVFMKKLKNGCHFLNMHYMEKFQITVLPQSLGLWFSKCQQKWNISVGHYEKIENGHHFVNMHHTAKFQITEPHPKSFGLWFSKYEQKWNISVGHYEKIEKWLPFCKYASYGKNYKLLTPTPVISFPITTPRQVLFQHLSMATLKTFMRGDLSAV